MAEKRQARQIKYLNMGYEEFLRDLTNFKKVFFPGSSKDSNPASSGQMMTEEAAFIGDVLSHYLEDRFQNSNLVTARDVDQIYKLAKFLGYNPEGPRAAGGTQNFYLEVPATTGSAGNYLPDTRYAIKFKNVQLQNANGIIFEVLDDVDFSKVNISSSLEVRVSETTTGGIPTKYVLKTTAPVVAGRTITQEVAVGDYESFREIEISEANVLSIESVTDSEGNTWYEVDHLAQEAIFEGIKNVGSDSEHVPYILKIKTVPYRFIKRTNPSTGKTTLIFGTGKATDIGTPFVPNPSDIAIDLKGKLTFSPPTIDPQNFLKTRTLGLAPYNTTLTIKARVGGGKITNTARNGLRDIISKVADYPSSGLNATQLNGVLSSFASNNTTILSGGDEAESPEEIKQFASANFAAQGRLTIREDYIARCLSLPSQFGKVFRAFAATDCNKQGGVRLWVLAKNEQNQIITPTDSLKKNLKNYLSRFTRMGQGIDILNGQIINIGIDYTIVVAPGYNKTSVKLETLRKIKDFFLVDKWQLNQPIVTDEIRCLIKDTEGVISVSQLNLYNKNNVTEGRQYSETVYSLSANTKNGIVFCPSNAMFELKFGESDIKVGAI